MSTQAASTRSLLRAVNLLRKNWSSVSFFRSGPNHGGSPVSRLLNIVMNFADFPKKISSTQVFKLRHPALCLPWLHFLDPQAAVRTPHSIQLDDYRGPKLETRKIAHFALGGVRRFGGRCG
jgi:hypothetical protein